MKQTKWNQPHEYEPAGAIDFRGEVLCHCGLPPDSGLHKQKHQDQTKPKASEWEREFDKWFNHGTKDKPHGLLASDYYKEVKSFIQSLLDQQRQEIIEELEGMREKAKDSRRGDVDLDDLYEGALTDAILKIKGEDVKN